MTKKEFIKYFENLQFFTASPEIVMRIAKELDGRIQSKTYADGETLSPEDEAEYAKFPKLEVRTDIPKLTRFISEQLYLSLARVSRQHAGNPLDVCISDFVTNRLIRSLRLPNIENEIKEIAEEFDAWLAQKAKLATTWGLIKYTGQDSMSVLYYAKTMEASRGVVDRIRETLGLSATK